MSFRSSADLWRSDEKINRASRREVLSSLMIRGDTPSFVPRIALGRVASSAFLQASFSIELRSIQSLEGNRYPLTIFTFDDENVHSAREP
jgi:hypothetical protein